jgi:hypothetical protein
MRFYNFETVLLDDREFRPADLEPRNIFGMPIVTENTRVPATRRSDCGDERYALIDNCDASIAA